MISFLEVSILPRSFQSVGPQLENYFLPYYADLLFYLKKTKNDISLSRCFNFFFLFGDCRNFKIWDVIILTLLLNRSFTFYYFVKILYFVQRLMICQIFSIHFYVYCEDWRLHPGRFMALIKLQYNTIF